MNRLSFRSDSDRTAVGVFEKTLQNGNKLRTGRAKFIQVVQRQFAQDLFPIG